MDSVHVGRIRLAWDPARRMLRVTDSAGRPLTRSEREHAARTLTSWVGGVDGYVILFDGAHAGAPDAEAREFWAQFFRRTPPPRRWAACRLAVAVRGATEAWQQSAPFPVRVFDDEPQALAWLSE